MGRTANAAPVTLRASAFQPKPSVLVRRSPRRYTGKWKKTEREGIGSFRMRTTIAYP